MSQATANDEAFVPYIGHDEFRRGARHGPVPHRQPGARAAVRGEAHPRVDLVAHVVIGVGAALALTGQALAGVVLVAVGIAANRLVRYQAGQIVLQLARDPAAYAEVTSNGVMEVRPRLSARRPALTDY